MNTHPPAIQPGTQAATLRSPHATNPYAAAEGPPSGATNRPFGIGGSDIGAVLGLSPYRSAVDVWADLVGRVPRETHDAVHLRFGQHAESFVAAEYERATGRALVECPQTLFHSEHGFMFAHVDRLVLERAGDTALEDGRVLAPGVLECKTANAFSAHGWGEPGSDRVPAAYLAQCAWYTAVTGCAWADLAVLIGNNDFRVYRLARDPELEALVLGRAKAFWYENVLAQRPPAARTASDAATLFPRSAPGSQVEATAEVLEALQDYRARQAQLQALTEESESLKALVLAHMGEAEALSHAGRTVATWRSARASQRLDTRSLEAEHPDLAARYRVSVAGSRRFLLREGA